MNSQGLAAGLNEYGVSGHLGNEEAFATQLQPNGTWGPPTALWSGAESFSGGSSFNVGIFGISGNGQVLGYGVQNPSIFLQGNTLYLYDTNTHQLTDMTNLVNSLKWTNSTDLPVYQSSNWNLDGVPSQIDNQGRILVQATEGYGGPDHNLLLVPQDLSSAPVTAPEPATWAIFATLIGSWLCRWRVRPATRPG